jgi:hypothetical protein
VARHAVRVHPTRTPLPLYCCEFRLSDAYRELLTPFYLLDRHIPGRSVCPDQLPVVAQLRPGRVRLADSRGIYGPPGPAPTRSVLRARICNWLARPQPLNRRIAAGLAPPYLMLILSAHIFHPICVYNFY